LGKNNEKAITSDHKNPKAHILFFKNPDANAFRKTY